MTIDRLLSKLQRRIEALERNKDGADYMAEYCKKNGKDHWTDYVRDSEKYGAMIGELQGMQKFIISN